MTKILFNDILALNSGEIILYDERYQEEISLYYDNETDIYTTNGYTLDGLILDALKDVPIKGIQCGIFHMDIADELEIDKETFIHEFGID